MEQLKKGQKELHIVDDKLGTPTYTHDFAANVRLLIEKDQRGLFNMVCSGLTSRLDVANEIVRLLNIEDRIEIVKVNSDYFAKEYFADRPACERLINKRLNDLKLNLMNDWRTALSTCIKEYYPELKNKYNKEHKNNEY